MLATNEYRQKLIPWFNPSCESAPLGLVESSDTDSGHHIVDIGTLSPEAASLAAQRLWQTFSTFLRDAYDFPEAHLTSFPPPLTGRQAQQLYAAARAHYEASHNTPPASVDKSHHAEPSPDNAICSQRDAVVAAIEETAQNTSLFNATFDHYKTYLGSACDELAQQGFPDDELKLFNPAGEDQKRHFSKLFGLVLSGTSRPCALPAEAPEFTDQFQETMARVVALDVALRKALLTLTKSALGTSMDSNTLKSQLTHFLQSSYYEEGLSVLFSFERNVPMESAILFVAMWNAGDPAVPPKPSAEFCFLSQIDLQRQEAGLRRANVDTLRYIAEHLSIITADGLSVFNILANCLNLYPIHSLDEPETQLKYCSLYLLADAFLENNKAASFLYKTCRLAGSDVFATILSAFYHYKLFCLSQWVESVVAYLSFGYQLKETGFTLEAITSLLESIAKSSNHFTELQNQIHWLANSILPILTKFSTSSVALITQEGGRDLSSILNRLFVFKEKGAKILLQLSLELATKLHTRAGYSPDFAVGYIKHLLAGYQLNREQITAGESFKRIRRNLIDYSNNVVPKFESWSAFFAEATEDPTAAESISRFSRLCCSFQWWELVYGSLPVKMLFELVYELYNRAHLPAKSILFIFDVLTHQLTWDLKTEKLNHDMNYCNLYIVPDLITLVDFFQALDRADRDLAYNFSRSYHGLALLESNPAVVTSSLSLIRALHSTAGLSAGTALCFGTALIDVALAIKKKGVFKELASIFQAILPELQHLLSKGDRASSHLFSLCILNAWRDRCSLKNEVRIIDALCEEGGILAPLALFLAANKPWPSHTCPSEVINYLPNDLVSFMTVFSAFFRASAAGNDNTSSLSKLLTRLCMPDTGTFEHRCTLLRDALMLVRQLYETAHVPIRVAWNLINNALEGKALREFRYWKKKFEQVYLPVLTEHSAICSVLDSIFFDTYLSYSSCNDHVDRLRDALLDTAYLYKEFQVIDKARPSSFNTAKQVACFNFVRKLFATNCEKTSNEAKKRALNILVSQIHLLVDKHALSLSNAFVVLTRILDNHYMIDGLPITGAQLSTVVKFYTRFLSWFCNEYPDFVCQLNSGDAIKLLLLASGHFFSSDQLPGLLFSEAGAPCINERLHSCRTYIGLARLAFTNGNPSLEELLSVVNKLLLKVQRLTLATASNRHAFANVAIAAVPYTALSTQDPVFVKSCFVEQNGAYNLEAQAALSYFLDPAITSWLTDPENGCSSLEKSIEVFAPTALAILRTDPQRTSIAKYPSLALFLLRMQDAESIVSLQEVIRKLQEEWQTFLKDIAQGKRTILSLKPLLVLEALRQFEGNTSGSIIIQAKQIEGVEAASYELIAPEEHNNPEFDRDSCFVYGGKPRTA